MQLPFASNNARSGKTQSIRVRTANPMLASMIPSWQSQSAHQAPDQIASPNISFLQLILKEAFRSYDSISIVAFSSPRRGLKMIVHSKIRQHRFGFLRGESESRAKRTAAENQEQRLALQTWLISFTVECVLNLGNRCRSSLIARLGGRFGFCLRNPIFGMVRQLCRKLGNDAGNTRVRRQRFYSPAMKSRPR